MNVFGAVKSVVGSWPECEGPRQGVTGAGWHMKGTLTLSTHHLALGGAVPPESAGSQIIRNTGDRCTLGLSVMGRTSVCHEKGQAHPQSLPKTSCFLLNLLEK